MREEACIMTVTGLILYDMLLVMLAQFNINRQNSKALPHIEDNGYHYSIRCKLRYIVIPFWKICLFCLYYNKRIKIIKYKLIL